MALDTATKRATAVNVGSPWRSILPFPDGTIDAGDRAGAAFFYSGLAAGEPVADTIVGRDAVFFVERRGVIFEQEEREVEWIVPRGQVGWNRN